MSVTVRPARADEAAALVPLYEWLFAPPGVTPDGWDPADAATRLRSVIEDPASEALVADAGGEPVGFCVVYRDIESVRFGRRAWVEDLAVHPERRSLGIGKALLDAAKAWARAQGCTHLELDSAMGRTDAHRFYAREGASPASASFGWRL